MSFRKNSIIQIVALLLFASSAFGIEANVGDTNRMDFNGNLYAPSFILPTPAVAPTAGGAMSYNVTNKTLFVGNGSSSTAIGTSAVNARSYLACNGTTDDRAALASLIQAGGACAGKDCVIPVGCTILLSSPGAGNAAVTMPSGTRLICEDRVNATFTLARHYCSGGSQPGSWADATVTCRSGTKTCDGVAAPDVDNCEFAPTSGSTYTILSTDLYAAETAVIGCKFDLRQVEAYGRCAGGSQAGKACSTADTNATTGCPSSTCTVDPEEPAGDGKIVAIDFGLFATDTVIDDVEIYNAKYSDYVVRQYTGGVSRRLQIDSYDTNTPAVIPTFGLTTLLTLNGAASVFDSSFGRGTLGVDAVATSSIVAHSRFTNTTSGVSGTGKLLVDSNRIDALSGGGGFGVAAGNYSTIIGNTVTGAADGVRVATYSQVVSNNLVTTTYGVRINAAVGSSGQQNQITSNRISGQNRIGIELSSGNQVVGNTLSGGSVSDTTTSPVTPSTAITVASVQNIVSGNYITGPWFFGLHPVTSAAGAFNIGIWSNRFAFGPVGPAIVTGGAGWHIGTNYFNQVQGGWCSDPTASNYLGACSCTTLQCAAGSELGKNCTVDGDCAGGGAASCAAITTTVDNPYGKYGATTGSCFATGLNSGGTCDSTLAKADCTWAPIIQIGQDAQLPGGTAYSSTSHPSFVLARGWGSSGAHIKIENNILARGTGQTDIRFGDAKVCSGTNTASCQGTGGNAGQACTADSDCTSTGCLWGTGNCCGYIYKLCSSATDCLSKQCDKTSPTAPWGTSCTAHADCGAGSHCVTVSNQCNSTSLTSGAYGKVCSTDADCGDTTGTQCAAVTAACSGLSHSDTSIVSNYFYPGYQALDASQTNGTIDGLALSANTIDASPRGIKFSASKVSRAVVQGNTIHLAVAKTGSELENWASSMGIAASNFGLSGGEQQTNEVYMINRNGAVLTAGYALQADTGTANGVEVVTANFPENFLGIVAADSAADGDPVRVVLTGVTNCYVSATVAIGDRLTVDAATAGQLVKVTAATQGTVARALNSRSGAGIVACLVGQGSGTYTSATQTNYAWAKKTADESVTSSTTYQADDHLLLALTNGKAYSIEGYIFATSSAAGGGAKIAVDSSGTATDWYMTVCGGASTGCGSTNTFSSTATIHNLSTVNGGVGFWIIGSVKPSQDLTIKVWWAQNSSSGTATIFKRGSYLRAIEIP